jgi:hypothetical protein
MIKTTRPITFLSLSLATNSSSDGSSIMEAQEYVQYELDFDLNNPFEVTEEDVWDVLDSIGGTSNVLDDDCEVEPIPSYSDLQSSFGTIRRYMESRSCDVSKYVGLLVQIEKYLQVVHEMNLTKEPWIHTSPVICKLDIE